MIRRMAVSSALMAAAMFLIALAAAPAPLQATAGAPGQVQAKAAAADSTAARAGDIDLETTIVQATVYSSEAQITRRGKVSVRPGEFRLICRDLPQRFVESSLNVGGSGTTAVKIIGIDLERVEKKEVDSERYKDLKASLEKIDKDIKDIDIKIKALRAREELMGSITKFSSDDARDKLAREKFTIADWKAVLDFAEAEDLATSRKRKELEAAIDDLRSKRKWLFQEISAMRTGEKDSKAVVISCESESAGEFTVDIEYLVSGASWTPEYTLRLIEDEKKVDLSYNARISQATGEDWKGVSVFLSTSRPSIGAAPPMLSPYYIGWTGGRISGRVIDASTGAPVPYANVVVTGTSSGAMTLRDGSYMISGIKPGSYIVKVMMMGYRPQITKVALAPGRDAVADFSLTPQELARTKNMTVGAEGMQGLPVDDVVQAIAEKRGEILSGDELHVRGVGPSPAPPVFEAPRVGAEVTQSEFGATLKVARPVDLETGAEPKRSLIVSEKFKGDMKLRTVPLLSENVFIEGETENSLDIPLLEGTAEVYVETSQPGSKARVSNFVGRETVGPVAPGEKLSLHFGADQDMKVSHKLEKKEYLTRAGKSKSKIRYSYLITIENFKKEAAEVSVLDRIPVSMKKEVEIDDVDLEPEPVESSEDGISTWKVTVPAGGSAEIRIRYTIVFPGDWTEDMLGSGM